MLGDNVEDEDEADDDDDGGDDGGDDGEMINQQKTDHWIGLLGKV